eukprot:CAMPEP_0197175688 /NCGR_PEP_ID=MMETSP1423-20130617/1834_1 /TAXON_ID=476441 /ORGANISM="Pseudo-nitzschia heimii, Strain UNC1101" /LENGTH=406 /DNA_ID=CAMNT_0042624905 /DNA_START=414 /DNA_END=1634 /DNA_ORIENTATION=+
MGFPGIHPSIGNSEVSGRPTSDASTRSGSHLKATRSRRLSDNAEGPLYINDKCINCSACSMFAPSVFARETTKDSYHVVAKQPTSEREIEESRAALAACPVAAIRVEKAATASEREQSRRVAEFAINPKSNGRPLPFPRRVSENLPDVYFLGHHNSKSFGAAPYLVPSSSSSSSSAAPKWIMVDSPRYSKAAVQAMESVTGPDGPHYLVLTHVDDTADHNRWKNHYPNLKRVFHSGDLGVHNWIGDETLEAVEILLESRSSDHRLQFFNLNGSPIDGEDDAAGDDVVLVHTPGHSPGSIALLKRPTSGASTTAASDARTSPGVLFSGDTYSYTTRDGGHMSGFPRYGNDPKLQSKILPRLLDLDWKILAPGHGHVRDYTLMADGACDADARREEMEAAIDELSLYF